MRAYKFSRDCEITASAQSFPALVPHRSCDKNGLLTSIKLRKRLTVAHNQEGDKHQVKQMPEISSEKLLVQNGNDCSEVAASDC